MSSLEIGFSSYSFLIEDATLFNFNSSFLSYDILFYLFEIYCEVIIPTLGFGNCSNLLAGDITHISESVFMRDTVADYTS